MHSKVPQNYIKGDVRKILIKSSTISDVGVGNLKPKSFDNISHLKGVSSKHIKES